MRPSVPSTWRLSPSVRVQPSQHRVVAKQPVRQRRCSCNADFGEKSFDFDQRKYYQASVEHVRLTGSQGPVILLKLNDGGRGLILPVFVGEAESSALVKEVHKRPTARPMTHDLFKSAFEAVGFKVTLVRISALVGNTYHARMHIQRKDGTGTDYDIDARPSDAINMAVRFGAPVLVARDVATKMAIADAAELEPAADHLPETHAEISKTCKQEMLLYQDPTIMFNLQLQLAIQEEKYEEASQLRDRIERLMQQDQALRLVIAIETALEDGRYEEAARCRDELQALRTAAFQRIEPGHK